LIFNKIRYKILVMINVSNISYISRKYHHKLNKLSEPINCLLGTDLFLQFSLDSDGNWSTLDNAPDNLEFFWGEKLYEGHPYFRSPDFFQSGYMLPELAGHSGYKKTQGKMGDLGRVCQLLLIIRKTMNGIVGYGFATRRTRPGLENVYMNNMGIIDRFLDYFEESAIKMLQESEERKINLPDLLGGQFYEDPNIGIDNLTKNDAFRLLASIDPKPERARALLSLTPAEKRCLSEYLTGKSAKDIAREIHRSKRTVEVHLDNAKQKCGVNNRTQLFEFLSPVRDYL